MNIQSIQDDSWNKIVGLSDCADEFVALVQAMMMARNKNAVIIPDDTDEDEDVENQQPTKDE
jgi:hypothetical protein